MLEIPSPNCKHCGSTSIRKNGLLKPTKRSPDRSPIQRYRCNDCQKSFILKDVPRYSGDRKVSQYEATKRWRDKAKDKDAEN